VTPTLSVEAVQVRFTWLLEGAVAARLLGAVGGVVSPPLPVLARNAASCITHQLELTCVAGGTVAAVAVTV